MNRIRELDGVYIHDRAIVETESIGAGTRIWAFAHILKGAQVGENCNICDHTFIEADVVIGNNVTIKSGVYLWDGLRIEDNVFIGPNAAFTNDMRPRSRAYPPEFIRTHIRKGASIGANATVLAGVTLGQWAMIGAGSVVTKDVPDHGLVYGVPAKLQSYVCRCGRDLTIDKSLAECICGKTYQLTESGLVNIR
jgi:acetyltransferase-like isoleucine patch superfamily enzyme